MRKRSALTGTSWQFASPRPDRSTPSSSPATTSDVLFVNLFASGDAALSVGAAKVTVVQETDYPWAGRVQLRLTPESSRAYSARSVSAGLILEAYLAGM